MAALQIIGAIIAVLLLALGVIYWRADRETISAAQFRADSNYQTATLSHGVTAYQAFGPVDGVPVVIVHGGTLGSMAYQGYVPPLVEAGWRVIIYDQYGRGFSDRPKNKLSIDLMRRQLSDLLDDLEIEKAHLFGVSLGGAIIARFAAEHGDRVRSLAYQVPVIKGVEPTLALRLTRLPVLGTFLARLVGVDCSRRHTSRSGSGGCACCVVRRGRLVTGIISFSLPDTCSPSGADWYSLNRQVRCHDRQPTARLVAACSDAGRAAHGSCVCGSSPCRGSCQGGGVCCQGG